MNRIKQKINLLEKKNKKALIVYITAGFPDLKTTEKLVMMLEKNGVDFIELGMPFSDPIADGPTIQQSSCTALEKGMNMRKFFSLVAKLRKKTQVPLIMMSYYNPIFKYGLKRFAQAAKKCALDGVIVPDLPPEEANDLKRQLKPPRVSLVYLISPVTKKRRIRKIAGLSSTFLYYVSLTGVTGARHKLPSDLIKNVRRIKQSTSIPVYVGFGISTPAQVKNIVQVADGVIIGSAIIKIFQKDYAQKKAFKKIADFITSLNRVT